MLFFISYDSYLSWISPSDVLNVLKSQSGSYIQFFSWFHRSPLHAWPFRVGVLLWGNHAIFKECFVRRRQQARSGVERPPWYFTSHVMAMLLRFPFSYFVFRVWTSIKQSRSCDLARSRPWQGGQRRSHLLDSNENAWVRSARQSIPSHVWRE